MKSKQYEFSNDADMEMKAKNCSIFFLIYDYENFIVSKEELNFPLAYTILTHKDAVQTEKLLRAIYRPHNIYCIHVDKSSSTSLHNAMKAIASCFPNVFIVSKVEDVIYASFSRLQADLNCMTDLLQTREVPWKYMINLPSQEYPLKTNAEIVKILKLFHGKSSIEVLSAENWRHRFQGSHQVIGYEVEPSNKKKDPPPSGITIAKGSVYGIFSRSFVNYSINDVNAQEILKWLEDTYSPDEFFWATLARNSHLNVPGVFYNGMKSTKFWIAVTVSWEVERKCHGKYVHLICVFGIGDLNKLVSEKTLFANKFYHNYQPLALQCLEEWHFNKTFSQVPFDSYYYRNLLNQ
ncbi:LOW QUALITY PROTEIN: beta-1,3-galactosyl-O-glycosyl-glycoprotein beta-1,6-N-acetylglucosaminyltransferase 3-like [Saccostrea echinata]|uniref:LOW QUALITY PROTEIN: beta-1,3-galactosyl-O-glycosyl-glycoprotein beta-1,6-N-acetylglucosaminyltransferase 3-like n=1 Tax=Saccostrea echinata TaxID=191078 RepID=UPI002A803BC3|nr:LOW QUALITY PROTEIN: beta-1,3-galactosyl-O-glycosyl-glycoprotein beta-1,6-N-acetylglucosaminyltransferase 3-like [Saccostrea echinata]